MGDPAKPETWTEEQKQAHKEEGDRVLRKYAYEIFQAGGGKQENVPVFLVLDMTGMEG